MGNREWGRELVEHWDWVFFLCKNYSSTIYFYFVNIFARPENVLSGMREACLGVSMGV